MEKDWKSYKEYIYNHPEDFIINNKNETEKLRKLIIDDKIPNNHNIINDNEFFVPDYKVNYYLNKLIYEYNINLYLLTKENPNVSLEEIIINNLY